MNWLILLFLLCCNSLFGSETIVPQPVVSIVSATEKKEDEKPKEKEKVEKPNPRVPQLALIFINHGSYGAIMNKLKKFMPDLKIDGYLVINHYFDRQKMAAFADWRMFDAPSGKIVDIKENMLVWQKTSDKMDLLTNHPDLMMGER